MANTYTRLAAENNGGVSLDVWTFDSNGNGDAAHHGGGPAVLGVANDGDIDGGNIQWEFKPTGSVKFFNVGVLVTDPTAPVQNIVPLPPSDVRPVLASSAESTTDLVCFKS